MRESQRRLRAMVLARTRRREGACDERSGRVLKTREWEGPRANGDR